MWPLRTRVHCLALVAAGSLLTACQTTGPAVDTRAANGTVACSVGVTPALRTVRVEVWRGQEPGLSGYTTQRVCQRLEQISHELQTQGVSLRFELMGAVQTHPGLGLADNAAMFQAVTMNNGVLRLVVVDAIAQCGDAQTPTGGFIRGCTPVTGQPRVYLKRHSHWDPVPEWVGWAHEMGHAVGLSHPDEHHPPSYPERIMTYLPQPQSTTLTAAEAARYEQLGDWVRGPDGGEVGGGKPPATTAISARQLLPFVLSAGQHGVPLKRLESLDDAALLQLQGLLEPDTAPDTGAFMPPHMAVRINALATLAELGRGQAQAYVRDYLLRQNDFDSVELRRYGLWALGRGPRRYPNGATHQFLQQASHQGFWCTTGPRDRTSDCQLLADAARKARRDAGVESAEDNPQSR